MDDGAVPFHKRKTEKGRYLGHEVLPLLPAVPWAIPLALLLGHLSPTLENLRRVTVPGLLAKGKVAPQCLTRSTSWHQPLTPGLQLTLPRMRAAQTLGSGQAPTITVWLWSCQLVSVLLSQWRLQVHLKGLH